MVHAECVFVAGIYPSRTWTSRSFESMQWNVCVHRLDLGLYSQPKEFWGNEVRSHANFKGKILSTGKILPRGGSNRQCCIKQDSEPNTLPTSCSGPQCMYKGQDKNSDLGICAAHLQTFKLSWIKFLVYLSRRMMERETIHTFLFPLHTLLEERRLCSRLSLLAIKFCSFLNEQHKESIKIYRG